MTAARDGARAHGLENEERRLVEKLRKIETLFARPASEGERLAFVMGGPAIGAGFSMDTVGVEFVRNIDQLDKSPSINSVLGAVQSTAKST